MLTSLSPAMLPGGWLIRDEESLRRTIRLARDAGYEAIEISRIAAIDEVVRKRSGSFVGDLFAEAGIIPAGWHLEDAWRGPEDAYRQLLAQVPSFAKTSRQLACERAFIWMLNYSDQRDYDENFRWHVERLKPIVRILTDYGIRLAIEWQGPMTLMRGHKYKFIRDMKGTMELREAMDIQNTALLMDSWHWYTSGGTVEDIRGLQADDVTVIHVCDAPAGTNVDEQLDDRRAVPGETGVIDLVGFFTALKEIGCEAPVEPSVVGSDTLNKLSPQEAAEVNVRALRVLFDTAGIGVNQ